METEKMQNDKKSESVKKQPKKKGFIKYIVGLALLIIMIAYVAVKFVIGDGTEYAYVEDATVYGLENANTMFSQKIRTAENGSAYVTYNSDNNHAAFCANLDTKDCIKKNEMYLFDINIAGNTVYALEGIDALEGLQIVSFDVNNPKETTVLWEEVGEDNVAVPVTDLLLAEDTLYFVYNGSHGIDREDVSFMSLNLVTGEENVIDAPSFSDYFVDNGKVYFINTEDKNKLYSMSLVGGEVTKLSNFEAHYAYMYEGRIYYIGELMDNVFLMSMNPDGTNHKIHKLITFVDHATAFSDGKLYTYNGDSIFYIDLADETLTEHEISVGEQVISQIQNYYADYLDRKLEGREITDEEIKCKADFYYVDFGVSDGYVCFTPDCYFGGWIVRETFICDVETEEVYLLNKYFDIGSQVDKMELN